MQNQSKIKKLNTVLTYTWLGVAILAVLAGIHQTYYQGIGKSWLFFVITFIAVLMFAFRRAMGKNLNKK